MYEYYALPEHTRTKMLLPYVCYLMYEYYAQRVLCPAAETLQNIGGGSAEGTGFLGRQV
jgi:hypothetical protein